jgi:uncharacterized protein
MFYVFAVYGLIAGYFAGFLGLGVGVFLMPFYLMMNVPYHVAVDASLMAVFFSSLTSSIQHYKEGGLLLEPCVVMAVPGSICAIIGSFYLINTISPVLLMIIFAGIMFLNADFFHFMKKKEIKTTDPGSINHLRYFPLYIVVGVTVGLSASLLGIGGGIIIVPCLMRVAHYPVKDAVKVAVFVMIFTTFFGFSADLVRNSLPYYIGGSSAIGAIVGCFLGSIALKYVRQALITHVNYIVSLILGVIMLLRAIIY